MQRLFLVLCLFELARSIKLKTPTHANLKSAESTIKDSYEGHAVKEAKHGAEELEKGEKDLSQGIGNLRQSMEKKMSVFQQTLDALGPGNKSVANLNVEKIEKLVEQEAREDIAILKKLKAGSAEKKDGTFEVQDATAQDVQGVRDYLVKDYLTVEQDAGEAVDEILPSSVDKELLRENTPQEDVLDHTDRRKTMSLKEKYEEEELEDERPDEPLSADEIQFQDEEDGEVLIPLRTNPMALMQRKYTDQHIKDLLKTVKVQFVANPDPLDEKEGLEDDEEEADELLPEGGSRRDGSRRRTTSAKSVLLEDKDKAADKTGKDTAADKTGRDGAADKTGKDGSDKAEERSDSEYAPCLNSGWPVYNNNETLSKIYYINLDASRERRNFMEDNLRATGKPFERWSASTQADDKPESYKEFSRRGKKVGTRPGVAAAYLSHVRLLKHISRQPNSVYFIMEDDVKPAEAKWVDEVMCHIRELPKNWDVYKFGYFDSQPSKAKKGKRGCSHDLPEANRFSCSLQYYAHEYMGAQGYAMTPKGAKAMLNHLIDMPAMDIDGAMMNGQSWGGAGSKVDTNFYVSKQNLLIHGGFSSDMNKVVQK